MPLSNPGDPGDFSRPPVSFHESIFLQLGDVCATQRAHREDLGEIRAVLQELVADRRTTETTRRIEQAAILSRLEILERLTASNHHSNTAIIDRLVGDVEALKAPVQQFVNLRSKTAAVMLALVSLASVIWVVVGPVWSYFAQRLIGK